MSGKEEVRMIRDIVTKNRNRKKESPATEELSQVPFRGFRGKKQKTITAPNPFG